MKRILSILLLLSFLLSACKSAVPTPVEPAGPTATPVDAGTVIYTDPSQPVEARIEDLLKLTHEQSIAIRDPETVGRQLERLTLEAQSTEATVRVAAPPRLGLPLCPAPSWHRG